MTKPWGTLSVFGEAYKVFITDELGPDTAGGVVYDNKEIFIDKDAKGAMFTETLLHEFLHALFRRLSYEQSGIPHALEEVMIDQIARSLTENFDIKKKKALPK